MNEGDLDKQIQVSNKTATATGMMMMFNKISAVILTYLLVGLCLNVSAFSCIQGQILRKCDANSGSLLGINRVLLPSSLAGPRHSLLCKLTGVTSFRHTSMVRPATSDDEENGDEEESQEMTPTTSTTTRIWGRIKGYFLQEKTDDGTTFKQRLAKMGVATVLSYGMISNLSYAVLVSLAWYLFGVQTGKSPLAPGQWKPFLAVYTGFWVFNNIVRPLRLGLSIAIAPSLDRLVLFFQNRLKVSKPLAITVTVFFVNVVGTTLLMGGGIALASIVSGVPVFSPRGLA